MPKKFPFGGLTRRLRRGRGACSPMGRSIASGGDPKGTGGERKAPSAPAGANPCPRRGLTRRLRRGLGLVVPWGAHTFLSVAKEKCAKESQRHGDSGKKPFIAHFDGGARYVARSGVGQLTPTVVRARSSPFSAVKMGGPFSLRCLSPLCSPAVGGRQTYLLQVKMVPTAWRSCSAKYEGFCFRRSRRGAGLPLAGVISESCRPAGFGAQAMRPVARRRPVHINKWEPTSDPRAARPVAERR